MQALPPNFVQALQALHPHDRAAVLSPLCWEVIARLPPLLRQAAIAAKIATTSRNGGQSMVDMTDFDEACNAPTSCEASRILFTAARLPAARLRELAVQCFFKDGEERSPSCGPDQACHQLGTALHATLGTHAPTLQSLSLIKMDLTPSCAAALTAALRNSQLRLRHLVLNDIFFCGGVTYDARVGFIRAVQTQSEMTDLVLCEHGDGNLPLHYFNLSSFPNLESLTVAGFRAKHWYHTKQPAAWLVQDENAAALGRITCLDVMYMTAFLDADERDRGNFTTAISRCGAACVGRVSD